MLIINLHFLLTITVVYHFRIYSVWHNTRLSSHLMFCSLLWHPRMCWQNGWQLKSCHSFTQLVCTIITVVILLTLVIVLVMKLITGLWQLSGILHWWLNIYTTSVDTAKQHFAILIHTSVMLYAKLCSSFVVPYCVRCFISSTVAVCCFLLSSFNLCFSMAFLCVDIDTLWLVCAPCCCYGFPTVVKCSLLLLCVPRSCPELLWLSCYSLDYLTVATSLLL